MINYNNSIRNRKIEKDIKKKINYIFLKYVKDPKIKNVVLIDAKIKNDLKTIIIYYTVINKKEIKKIYKMLKKIIFFIKKKLFKIIFLHKVPELLFKFDKSIEYGRHIDKLINNLNK